MSVCRWDCFAAYASSEMASLVEAALQEAGADYRRGPFRLAAVQAFFLGGGADGIRFEVRAGEGTGELRIAPAFADPVTRLVFGFVGSERQLSAMKEVCVVQLTFPEPLRPILRRVLARAQEMGSRPFWRLDHHPRFQTAVLLAWRVRRRWQRLLAHEASTA